MNKKFAAEHIDFADSEYKFFHMSEDAILTIYMNSWQEIPLKLIFSHTVQFLYTLGDVPKDLYEISNNSSLDEMLLKMYGYKPKDHPFKLFHLEDIYDFPFIQVVAESVVVVKE
jgi:hypothetical protein